MEIITETYTLEKISHAIEKYFSEDTLLFDIECTGLSPRKSSIYLIGCASRKGKTVTITQLFANDSESEKEILLTFEEYIKSYNSLAGFNSTRFDDNFIYERCKLHSINTLIKSTLHNDIYLLSTKAKCILNLPNFKQKTFEEYLGLYREDNYNGGELIPIYQDYLTNHNEESKNLVLLHNLEDIKGMVYILDILEYVDLLNADMIFDSYEIEQSACRFSLSTTANIPISINKKRDYGFYIIRNNQYIGTAPIFVGTLNTYLDDFRNYYYLLNEDIITPKSIGQTIDKASRRNATKRDCKICKDGTFVMLPERMQLPAKYHIFKEDYDSKDQYILIDDMSDELFIRIAQYMIKH